MEGNDCFCYNEDCNAKERAKQNAENKAQGHDYEFTWGTFVRDFKAPKQRTPKCPYCKKAMTVIANMDD